jgi:flavin reductase
MTEHIRFQQTGSADARSVSEAGYRAAMSRLAGAVHLVTTDGLAGRAGFTASAVCSVSDAPPTLLVCINRTSSAYPVFSKADVLCVNTLGASQMAIASAFGGKTAMDQRFAAASWTRLMTGAPILQDALVSFDCRIVARMPVRTHDVLLCEVEAVLEGQIQSCLLYANRNYHSLPQPARMV